MKSLQLTRGKGRINRKFANMRAAKSRAALADLETWLDVKGGGLL